jgi:hypothetical protein
MKSTLVLFAALLSSGLALSAADRLHLPPKEGTANGKKIVLVSGDEEYRTEETMPMLAKILSQKHGFDCTVLFAINPDGGFIDSNFQKNIPGTEALNAADLMIIGTRFRQLPDDQLAHFAAFLNAGKPVIGIRTATHAFSGGAKTGEFKWAEFGLKILGEKWVNHHGRHKVEGTRSMVEAAHSGHEILRGVGEIFGPTDVYGIANLDQKAATILLRGVVTEITRPRLEGSPGAEEQSHDAARLAARVHRARTAPPKAGPSAPPWAPPSTMRMRTSAASPSTRCTTCWAEMCRRKRMSRLSIPSSRPFTVVSAAIITKS